MQPIPLNSRSNILMASAITGMSMDKIYDKMYKASVEYKKEKDKEWAIGFFQKDEQWYEATLEKVKQIESTLDENMDYKEKTIKLYGWIAKEVPKRHYSIPTETNQEYATARCIELILTKPDAYLKILNWE